MAGGEPVGNVAALRALRPVLRQRQHAYALGGAERCLRRGIGVRIAGGVMIGDNHDVGAAEAFAVGHAPFRGLADVAGAVRAAGRRDADAPQAVRVFLALDHENGALAGDRLEHLGQPIEDLADALSVVDPAALAVRPALPEPLRVPWRIADLLEQQIPLLVEIVVSPCRLATGTVDLAVIVAAAGP